MAPLSHITPLTPSKSSPCVYLLLSWPFICNILWGKQQTRTRLTASNGNRTRTRNLKPTGPDRTGPNRVTVNRIWNRSLSSPTDRMCKMRLMRRTSGWGWCPFTSEKLSEKRLSFERPGWRWLRRRRISRRTSCEWGMANSWLGGVERAFCSKNAFDQSNKHAPTARSKLLRRRMGS